MIERYSITCPADKIHERFTVDVPDFYRPHYNAAPTQLLPVITSSSPQGVSLFYWGIPPAWAKNRSVSEKIINLKIESLEGKASLRKVMLKRRCIVPADGFYAWKKVGKKTLIPYRFVSVANEIFSFAGIWEDFEDQDGEESHTFIVLTTAGDETVSAVTDRMPLILSRESEKIWLSENADENILIDQLKAKAVYGLTYYPVSPRINTALEDAPSLIAPTPPSDQHGNLTLFD
jgi:putative SOS response-associated peptidase YedK